MADGSISFSYSLKQNVNGEHVMKNEVHRQLQGHNYFLSPYTTWKIKLENLSEMNLESFGDLPIDLELNSHILSEISNKPN